jgi:ATP-dependent Clp protease protease subunit
MQYVRCEVATYSIGLSASMASLLLAGGTRGKRYCLPNARILLHQPLIGGVLQATATDLSIEAREIIRLRHRLYEIFQQHTGQPLARIEKDFDRNLWLDAGETLEYGVADKILEHMPATKTAPKPE